MLYPCYPNVSRHCQRRYPTITDTSLIDQWTRDTSWLVDYNNVLPCRVKLKPFIEHSVMFIVNIKKKKNKTKNLFSHRVYKTFVMTKAEVISTKFAILFCYVNWYFKVLLITVYRVVTNYKLKKKCLLLESGITFVNFPLKKPLLFLFIRWIDELSSITRRTADMRIQAQNELSIWSLCM